MTTSLDVAAADEEFPLWSERYDREMADVFEVQDEIARKIAEALRVTLSPQEQREPRLGPPRTCRPTTSTCGARATPGA